MIYQEIQQNAAGLAELKDYDAEMCAFSADELRES